MQILDCPIRTGPAGLCAFMKLTAKKAIDCEYVSFLHYYDNVRLLKYVK